MEDLNALRQKICFVTAITFVFWLKINRHVFMGYYCSTSLLAAVLQQLKLLKRLGSFFTLWVLQFRLTVYHLGNCLFQQNCNHYLMHGTLLQGYTKVCLLWLLAVGKDHSSYIYGIIQGNAIEQKLEVYILVQTMPFDCRVPSVAIWDKLWTVSYIMISSIIHKQLAWNYGITLCCTSNYSVVRLVSLFSYIQMYIYCSFSHVFSYILLYCYVPLTGQANLQDKVETLRDTVINLEDKLNAFQNATETSAKKIHHEVVELLENNTSCSLDGKI